MTQMMQDLATDEFPVSIRVDRRILDGILVLPPEAQGLVIFAHGSGSNRLSPRNRAVAQQLNRAGFATILFDLLTAEEVSRDSRTHSLSFDITLLSQRLLAVSDQMNVWPETCGLPLGYFGASTGAAAALLAAAECPERICAVVSRGGRPDLASARLVAVQAPTLLIVGGEDHEVITFNQAALAFLPGDSALAIVPGAGHLFNEPGAMAQVSRLATQWFTRFLR